MNSDFTERVNPRPSLRRFFAPPFLSQRVSFFSSAHPLKEANLIGQQGASAVGWGEGQRILTVSAFYVSHWQCVKVLEWATAFASLHPLFAHHISSHLLHPLTHPLPDNAPNLCITFRTGQTFIFNGVAFVFIHPFIPGVKRRGKRLEPGSEHIINLSAYWVGF